MTGPRRHLPGMQRLGMLALVCLLDACNPQAGTEVRYQFGIAHPDCGPADGPAVRLALSRALVAHEPHARPAPPSLTLVVNGSLGRALRSRVLIDAEGRGRAMTGQAERCDSTGACERGVSGWIRLRQFLAPAAGDTSLTGEYQIELPDGRREAGEFRVRWVRWAPLCG